MHGSNRGEGAKALEWPLPLIGILLALGLAWGLGWLQAREEHKREQTPAAYAAAAKDDAKRTCVGTDPAAVFECVNEKAKTAYQTAHDEQDLSAQQRAASSALAAAVFTFFALLISIVGVWFVKRTLDATLEAVKDTSEATDAMRQSNAIAENAQRPWIDIQAELVGFSRPTPSTVKFDVSVTFKNTGAMVAENFYAVAKGIPMGEPFLAHMKSWFDKFELEESLQIRDTVVIPNQSHSYRFSDTSAYEYFPWCNLPGYRRDCYYIVLAMARYRIPGQSQWRYAMKGFSIGENIDFVDNRKLIFDRMKKMTGDDIVIEPFGRSRGT